MEMIKLGEILNDSFSVVDSEGAPVIGLIDSDFGRTIYDPTGRDRSGAVPVTISELGRGMYRINCRPDISGEWTLNISHAEYFPAGQSATYTVLDASAETEESGIEEPEKIDPLPRWERPEKIELSEEQKAAQEISLAERYAALIGVSPDEYDPSILSDEILGDDWRIATAWYATLEAERDIDRTEEEIRVYAVKIVEETVTRDRVSFGPDTMTGTARALLGTTLWTLYGPPVQGRGVHLPPPHSRMIADGVKTMRLAQTKWDLTGFLALLDGSDALGMVRFEDPVEVDEAMFKKTRLWHHTTLDEIAAWGWTFPLYGWEIREFVLFDSPRPIKSDGEIRLNTPPPTVERYGIEEMSDIIPSNVEMISDTDLVFVDAWIQGEYCATLRGEDDDISDIVSSAAIVVREKEVREMESRLETSLDYAVERLRKGRLIQLEGEDDTVYAELRGLVEHTEDELRRAGLFDKDSDYDGMIAQAVMSIMRVFAKQGHSGFSASMCREIFYKLANFETLTPITSDPGEWHDVAGMIGGNKGEMWQNTRDPRIFSEDGGKTWYNVEDKDSKMDDDEPEAEDITLPFPNEHAARLRTPASLTPFIRIGRTKGSKEGAVDGVSIPESISVIWYVVKRDGKEVPIAQTLRFPTSTWTETEARAWLKRNEIKPILFEPAEPETGKLQDEAG